MKYLTTEKIPTWAICYLEYGDPTGLDDDDIMAADAFITDNFPTGYVMEISVDEDNCVQPYFTHYPAFGLAGEVYSVNFYEP